MSETESKSESKDESGCSNELALVCAVTEPTPEGWTDVSKYGFSMAKKCWTYLQKYRRGEIPGNLCAMKCAKHLIRGLGRAAGFAAGVAAGGAFGGTMSTILAGIGWHATGKLADILSKKLEERFFNESHAEAVRKAYEFMGITKDATDEQVRSAFHSKALIYHPDKRPDRNADLFHKLTLAKALIKLDRGNGTCPEIQGKKCTHLKVK